MKPRKQEPSSSDDLFRSRLENIINLRHELALLGERIDWAFFDGAHEAFCSDDGRPGIATRMMVGLHILKHMFDLSDDGVCDRWESATSRTMADWAATTSRSATATSPTPSSPAPATTTAWC